MSSEPLVKTVTEAVASIEDVASHIEDTFAQVGNRLGRGHAIFQELNSGLASLSQELSGAKTEGASVALRDIAARLNDLADALPAESALLGSLGKSATEVSSLLKPLFKQIQMITIIARSARIEAASIDGNRDSFIDFTREAFDLAKSVQHSVERCTRDQELLSDAVETALTRQKDFENLYRAQLLSVGADLTSAYSGMRDQQNKSVHLADLTSASTKRIAEAV
ncbi:MAG TPA: chemotaxis protein, partial [Phyllobacterium sp.]|nr:chemotaxis protein [Phyllobacterium sp.]